MGFSFLLQQRPTRLFYGTPNPHRHPPPLQPIPSPHPPRTHHHRIGRRRGLKGAPDTLLSSRRRRRDLPRFKPHPRAGGAARRPRPGRARGSVPARGAAVTHRRRGGSPGPAGGRDCRRARARGMYGGNRAAQLGHRARGTRGAAPESRGGVRCRGGAGGARLVLGPRPGPRAADGVRVGGTAGLARLGTGLHDSRGCVGSAPPGVPRPWTRRAGLGPGAG